MLDERKYCDYMVLTGGYDKATDLVHVTKKRVTKIKGQVISDEECNVTNLGQEAEDHIRNVVNGLKLGNDEYLIAIAWCTDEQKLHHKKFPFILGYDETFRTNAEKCPLLNVTPTMQQLSY